MEFLDKVIENWGAIEREPVAFLTVAFVGASIGYIVARSFYEHRLETAEQRLSLIHI